MRNFLLNLHLYGGLLCASYLIIFGVSSLQYNHHFWSNDLPAEPTEVWEETIALPTAEDDRALADAIRDELGLFGWPLAWTIRRDSVDGMRFTMVRTGRDYKVSVEPNGHVTVVSRHRHLGNVIGGLHATMRMPGSPFMSGWGIYTEICTWVVFFSAVSGVYLWASSRRQRVLGLLTLFLVSGGSIAFMLYVWLRG